MIDTNVYLSRWPFRRVYGDDTPTLVALLRSQGVTQAWTGSFDALLHKDIAGVNARLADECEEHGDGLLLPFGTVNPTLPNWENDIIRCAGMNGIRLHPNYHGYTLSDDIFKAVVDAATNANLRIQIAMTMEDERMMHPLMQVPHVDATPLLEGIDTPHPIMLLNAFRAVRGEALARLANSGQFLFDISWLEGAEGIARHMRMSSIDSLVFGSYAPLFYHESAKLKLDESPLTDDERAAITAKNTEKFLAR